MKLLLFIFFVSMFISCDVTNKNTDPSYDQINHKDNIVFESGTLTVFKINVDGIEYLVASRYQGGTAIIRHSK